MGFGKASDATSQKVAFEPDDVLYGKLRPYLDKAVLADRAGVATTELLVLRPKSDVSPEYLACVVHSPAFIEFARQGVTGAQHPRTSWAHIRTFALPAHDQSEQASIAKLLWCLFGLRMATEGGIMSASSLKRAAMQQLFTRGLRGEVQKETEIGLVPDSWKVGPLGNFVQFQRGFDITKSSQAQDGTIPVVSSGGVRSFHDVAAVNGPGVVIGRKGSIGSVHYVESDYWPHDTTLWSKDFLGNVPRFVFYRLQLVDMKRLDSGATNPALNRNFLHAEVISWPDVEAQQEIVDVLDALDRKIDLNRRKRDALDRLFKSLLHKLMTGEISVDNLDLSALPSIDGTAA